MFWDAYSATIYTPHQVILQGLVDDLDPTTLTVSPAAGLMSYTASHRINDLGGNSIARLHYGGANPFPHLACVGRHSSAIAAIVRRRWPGQMIDGSWSGHAVSRADSAMDFDEPGLFDKIYPIFRSRAKQANLQWKVYGDWDIEGQPGTRDPLSGRTFYVGSRNSVCFLRVYEKGLEQYSKWTGEGEPPSSGWVRAELEVKPGKPEMRRLLTSLAPSSLWGLSPFAIWACDKLSGLAVERQIVWKPEKSDAEATIHHCARQYRNALQNLLRETGSWEGIGEIMEQNWQLQDKMREDLKKRKVA